MAATERQERLEKFDRHFGIPKPHYGRKVNHNRELLLEIGAYRLKKALEAKGREELHSFLCGIGYTGRPQELRTSLLKMGLIGKNDKRTYRTGCMNRKNVIQNRAILEEMGVDELVRALQETSIKKLHGELQKRGFTATRATLTKYLTEMGAWGERKDAFGVLAVCGEADHHVRGFCKRFCDLYLKKDDMRENALAYVKPADFPQRDCYRAVIWIWDGMTELQDLPFEAKNPLHGRIGGKPVYIFSEHAVDACRNINLASPSVKSKMDQVYQESLKHGQA